MTNQIHFICREKLGIVCIDKALNLYISAAWRLSEDEVKALSGGMVYFHEKKGQPSYFGGAILKLDETEELPESAPAPGKKRYILTLEAAAKAKGIKWDKRGASHGMAWTSGVVVDKE